MGKSFFRELVDKISPLTKKYVQRQVDISDRIYQLLKENNMTQKDLAVKMDKKESFVSRILCGDGNPTLKTLVEFEVALGADVIKIPLLESPAFDEKREVSRSQTLKSQGLYLWKKNDDEGDASDDDKYKVA